MEPKLFQEKQISYLLGKAQNATKLVKNTSSKSLEEKKCQTEEHKRFQQNMKLPKHFSQNEGTTWEFSNYCTHAQTLLMGFATKPQQFLLPCKNKTAWRQLLCSELALTLKITKEEMTLLNVFPAILSGPHLEVVAAWAQKSFPSVTTETNVTLAICSPVFSRKFTYELHTKRPWSNKLFWTCTMKILLLYHHSPLAISFCLYKKPMYT